MEMITVDPVHIWQAYKEANEGDEVEIIEHLSPSLRQWLVKNILSKEFVNFLLEFPFDEDVQLCANYLYGPSNIKRGTEMYRSIKKEYIVIGSASNGDWIAVPRADWDTIGYISHDEFGYDKTDVVKYCPVSQSIGSFYHDTWHVPDYPCDYYEAIEFKRKLPNHTSDRIAHPQRARKRSR